MFTARTWTLAPSIERTRRERIPGGHEHHQAYIYSKSLPTIVNVDHLSRSSHLGEVDLYQINPSSTRRKIEDTHIVHKHITVIACLAVLGVGGDNKFMASRDGILEK